MLGPKSKCLSYYFKHRDVEFVNLYQLYRLLRYYATDTTCSSGREKARKPTVKYDRKLIMLWACFPSKLSQNQVTVHGNMERFQTHISLPRMF